MTIIVGVEHDGIVTLGGDAQSTGHGLNRTIKTSAKVWRDTAGHVYGVSGYARFNQVMRYHFSAPVLPEWEWDVDRWMAVEFTDELRRVAANAGVLETANGVESLDSYALVGVRDRLYRLESNFQFAHSIHGYQAIGSGCPFALGALWALGESEPTGPHWVPVGLQAAAEFNAGCGGPFTIVTTGGNN